MDWVNVKTNIDRIFKKYKYVIFVALVGIVLMMIPNTKEQSPVVPAQAVTNEQQTVQQQLEEILCAVKGAGRVKVFLTVMEGEEKVYQTNQDQSSDNASDNLRLDTVIITDEDRNQEGILQKTLSPKYRGAIVVCQGGDDPAIRLAIVDAVSKVTGLGSNQIAVLKMN